MRVAIVGTGYVGLVTGVCLADKGHQVTCVDVDAAKIERIKRGIAPIHEKGLDQLLSRHVNAGLAVTSDLAAAVADADVTMLAVGTPFAGTSIDLGQVKNAARAVGACLRDRYHVVVVKSTVVPGTTDSVVQPLLEEASGKRAGADFGVAMNPEFLREGEAIADFMNPDRIVLGANDARALEVLEELYAVFPHVEKLRTSCRTAEMIKYAANSLLATMISFSNEIANLCSAIGGIDVVEVLRGVHLDRRLSPVLADGRRVEPGFLTYLEAGCGFGGSCLPKDVRALIAHGDAHGRSMRMLDAVIAVNEAQPNEIVNVLERHFPLLAGVRVAVLGLAFKPETDDVRESPSLTLLRTLAARGAKVIAYDPVAEANARAELAGVAIEYGATLDDAIAGAEAVVLMTRWPELARVPSLIADREPAPLVVDARRMLPRESVKRYDGIGM